MLVRLADHAQLGMLRLRGFTSRHVTTSVGRVHVVASNGRGDGPPVVVLHGIAASSVHFWQVLPGLRRRSRRVLALDLPGHGFSDVPPAGLHSATLSAGLVEALDQVSDEPFVLVGNSLGGLGAIRYALARPGRVRSLLLLSPGGAPMDDAGLLALTQIFRMTSWEAARAFVRKLYARAPWYAQALAPVVRASFERPQLRSLVDSITHADMLAPDELARLTLPVRLLWGTGDALLPRENLAFFRAHLPSHAQIEEPEGFGHCPYLDQPARLTAAIEAFGGT